MAYYNDKTIVYLNGEFVKAVEAKMDLYSQSLHYGYSVFEGIRSYKAVNGETAIESLGLWLIEQGHRVAVLVIDPSSSRTGGSILGDKTRMQGLSMNQDAYIRPVVYAPANMSFVKNKESFIVIEAWEMQPFLGEKLLRVMTSSFERPNPKAFKIHAKATGHYVNSLLASQEAKTNGFDEALLLDMNGFVAEGPGANIFYEKDGKLYTPSPGNILPGITRATVLELCDELRIAVEEKSFTIEELKKADAVFYCGTAAEVIGGESLDETVFPKPWDQTLSRTIQDAYKHKVVEKAYKTTFELA